MALEITCNCGSTVPFAPDGDDHAPLVESCDSCGRVWRLSVDCILS